MKQLSSKLKELRHKKQITQEGLARAIGVTVSTIRNYEMIKNPRKPTPNIYSKLAQFFNVPIEYLLYDEIENTIKENIDIQKELGLSDEAIRILKQHNSEIVNEIITSKAFEIAIIGYEIYKDR